MEKPHSFAGRAIHKYGKTTTNDYAQPDKFFADMAVCLRQLDDIPFSAVEDLAQYELNRDVLVQISRRIYKIFVAANVDLEAEFNKAEEDPFDGLEEDLELKKKLAIKISGEEQ